jgi:3-deoxy-D-manno-octulosonate 8-phosphate phosphatase (KDO 8-P phosphatase)
MQASPDTGGTNMSSLEQTAAKLRLLVLDVDGVLTDGRIYYGNDGEEIKAFNIKDGLGIKLLQRASVKVAIITGRQSEIVARRARELGISEVIQGREDKRQALLELCSSNNLSLDDCAYMGDDLPDLAAIRSAGLGMTVADASRAVREAADWCSSLQGGCGAVREACEFILAARGEWSSLEQGFA